MTFSTSTTTETQAAAQERRLITAVFADVVDSTSLAERMDPEDWSGAIRRVLDLMSAPIERYGGTVAQRMGDGLLAVFGAPAAHEDDATRAVQAAVEMVAAVAEAGPEIRRTYGRELGEGPHVRVGVNTGLAIVEGIGERSRDVDALGDTVNVAARMQSAARANSVLATAETWRYASNTFDGRSLGGIAVKGKSEPVEAWEVIGRRDAPTSGRGLDGLRSVMVGRDAELEQLTSLLSAIRAGRGRTAVILGEPGVGKSRLLAELRRVAVESESPPRWIEAKGISYGENTPYGLIEDLVAACLGLPTASMTEERARVLLETSPQVFGDDWHEPYVAIASLLSLPLKPEEAAELAPLSPQALRLRYLGAVQRVARHLASGGPSILVIEDAHWADASSVEVLSQLLPLGHEVPVLMVLTSRPDRNAAGWRVIETARETFGDALTELALTPLDASTSRLLIGNLLDIDSLPERLRVSIMERSEGNPFFVEELIRMLIERGWVVRKDNYWVGSGTVAEAEVPDTLRGLLLARIDRLSDESRRTLRIASVIGRDVPLHLLETITGDTASTNRSLGMAEAAGLVRFAAADPEPIYRFRHVLIQEAAYDSLLKADRRRLHRRVGEVLEAESGTERREELAPILGLHFERAGDGEKAADYLLQAGRQALRRRSVEEATELLTRAFRALQDVSESPENSRRWIEVAIELASANILGYQFDADIERLREAVTRAEQLGDEHLLGLALSRLTGTLSFATGMFRSSGEVHAVLERALEIGHRLNDPEILAIPSALKGVELARGGNRKEAIPLLEEAEGALEQYQVNEASFYAGMTMMTHAELGNFDAAERWLIKTRDLAELSHDPKAQADLQIFTGQLRRLQGRNEEALAASRLGFELAVEAKEVFCQTMGSYMTGQMELAVHGAVPAIEWLDRAADLSRQVGVDEVIRMCDVTLYTARAMNGAGPEAITQLDELIKLTHDNDGPLEEALAHWRRAQALLATPTGDRDAAKRDLEASVAILTRLGTQPYLGIVRHDLATFDTATAGTSSPAKPVLPENAPL
jgi:predicted ATPase/class 3 adenylate cyclase